MTHPKPQQTKPDRTAVGSDRVWQLVTDPSSEVLGEKSWEMAESYGRLRLQSIENASRMHRECIDFVERA